MPIFTEYIKFDIDMHRLESLMSRAFGHACKFGLSHCIKTGASILTILIIAIDTGQGGGGKGLLLAHWINYRLSY